MMLATKAAIMNAAPAVMNQPPTTETTPVTRYTALSRPHARSASEVPIPTMNVTYVVERGNFNDVPTAMSKPPSTRFTDARTRSKATSSRSSSGAKRFAIHLFTLSGVFFVTASTSLLTARTRLRATEEVPNISLPSSCWLERSIDVCSTLRAFLLVNKAYTIMAPAATRKNTLVFAGRFNEPIINESTMPLPLATKSLKDSNPANVTPMKFTRSLPAKAMARENVPISTTILSTFIFSKCNSCIRIVKNTKAQMRNIPVCSKIR